MSLRESVVKISRLGREIRKIVNRLENEEGTHKMLSRPSPPRLHIRAVWPKRLYPRPAQLFLVNDHRQAQRGPELDQFITI